MSDSDAVSGLPGTIRHLSIERQQNGYRVRCGNGVDPRVGYEMLRQEYVAETKERLAKLVIFLMADPPEPGPA
jgi:hypothetical protein